MTRKIRPTVTKGGGSFQKDTFRRMEDRLVRAEGWTINFYDRIGLKNSRRENAAYTRVDLEALVGALARARSE